MSSLIFKLEIDVAMDNLNTYLFEQMTWMILHYQLLECNVMLLQNYYKI